MKQVLNPLIEDLRLECVLMQAWKKTSAYLRYHSWYSDTLGIDYQSLRVDKFIVEIQNRLKEPELWQSYALQLVPAPKSQKWKYSNEQWEPIDKNVNLKIRPLAHVNLQDQVISTAIMLCLANRVETFLGDPRLKIGSPEKRKQVLSYGHRLFCDNKDGHGQLFHRWGSSKLYREYFHDYQTFLNRPKVVAEEFKQSGYEVAIVQSDLSKFYDRVRPSLLKIKMLNFLRKPEEEDFFTFAARVLNWRWTDHFRAKQYAKNHGILDFDNIALPQGLVAAGFFANIVLSDLDKALCGMIGQTLPNSKLILLDACYYVDDFRLVLRVPIGSSEEEVKAITVQWLQNYLKLYADGLVVSLEKTEVTIEGRERRFLIKQSSEANRIQNQVSGVFDMQHGTELISAIEGFFRTQQRYSVNSNPNGGLLVGVPDMGDDTAARFAAGKFRRTFRSLRPLLNNGLSPEYTADSSGYDLEEEVLPHQLVLTKEQLDERAKFFSAMLIEEWIKNPGNVRLLRIALDIYPDTGFLEQVLFLLRPGWNSSKVKKAKREVRLYCLAELFRVGATETGFVEEDECLPSGISLIEYHNMLVNEAQNLLVAYLELPANPNRFPWYLMQQVFLYLSARNAFPDMRQYNTRGGNLSHYWTLAKFISGQAPKNIDQRAIYNVIITSAFGIPKEISSETRISAKYLRAVEKISPQIAFNLWSVFKTKTNGPLAACANHLGLEDEGSLDSIYFGTLAQISRQEKNPFLEEENLLNLALWLLKQNIDSYKETVTPWNIKCKITKQNGYEFGKVISSSFSFVKAEKATHLFEPPDWCESQEEKQKYQIGLLLRYAIRGSTSFYGNFDSHQKKVLLQYKKPVTNWEQQRYSGYHGREAFGPAWLPLSSPTEDIMFELLRWPGTGYSSSPLSLSLILSKVSKRLNTLRKRRGSFSSSSFLEQYASWPGIDNSDRERLLRVGIVQSVVPRVEDYNKDNLQLLNDPYFRLRHRSHLASIMEGITQMLRIRNTHSSQKTRGGYDIDLLIFPELAIHPQDIKHYILPFVRKYRCIVLFGQVYHPKYHEKDSHLINSCLWMIPEFVGPSKNLRIRYIEQGKKHLAKPERDFPNVVGFRPSQWLIKYKWHHDRRPLTLSASVCYDATDLALAADLRNKSDLYIVCALNQDVNTFDRMSESLHYHMYQGVIVVNNGHYGGSSLYIPRKKSFLRQVLHLHGQSQASIAFAELDPSELMQYSMSNEEWKSPPAGLDKV